jgi:dihydrofolate synthase/folylpolyglutamate synthase
LLRALGSPEQGLRGALIGGTNGKGSVQALVASVLRASGQRVGQTPKPHLVSYRERIVVDGAPIAPDAFAALVDEVVAIADRIERRYGPPTEFELLTAAAFAWFARAAVPTAVVEVGLGGRLDATNAWDGGVASITNVDLDHTDRLGTTIGAIAREKAAIVKRGNRAVTGARGEGLDVIRRRARRVRAPLREVAPLPVERVDRAGLLLRHERLGEFRLGLLGRHQAANAAVAIATLDALVEAGVASLRRSDYARGLRDARWPGRLELLAATQDGMLRTADSTRPTPGSPDVLLDGAHNPAGMTALAEAFDELRPSLSPGRPTVLLALMSDKDARGILEALASADALRGARIIATDVSERSLPADVLAAAWHSVAPTTPATSTPRLEAALADAVEAARQDDGPLLVAGSLYLVGAVRARLVGHEPRV